MNEGDRRVTTIGARPKSGYLVAVGGVGALTAGLLPLRDHITPLSESLGYLLIVMLAAVVGGLWPGVSAAVLGFLAFNYFFIPPHNTPYIARPEDFAVLVVFLVLSVLISALLARAQEQSALAEAKRRQFESLQSLFAQLVEIRSGHRSYGDVVRKVAAEFAFEHGRLFLDDQGNLTERASTGAAAATLTPAWEPGEEGRTERLPLILDGKTLGILVLGGDRPPLSREESETLRSFCDQLALIVESARLREVEKQAAALSRTDAQRRGLLEALSQELGGPLAGMNTSAGSLVLEDPSLDRGETRSFLQSVMAETDLLIGLAANLKDMVRIESGLAAPDIADVSLQDLIPKAVQRIRSSRPSLRVYASGHEEQTVRADPRLLDRVLANLLQNAARASESAGADRVEVLVTGDGEQRTVAVIDHGTEVPLRERERLFRPDYRLQEPDPPLATSLGYAVAKGLVSLMDGDLWVEDSSPGGTTVAFSLPAGR